MGTASRLYLFHPAACWGHCGGATLVCADSAEEAVALGSAAGKAVAEGNDGFHLTEAEALAATGGRLLACERWVLVRDFALAEPLPKGVVFSEANFA